MIYVWILLGVAVLGVAPGIGRWLWERSRKRRGLPVRPPLRSTLTIRQEGTQAHVTIKGGGGGGGSSARRKDGSQ